MKPTKFDHDTALDVCWNFSDYRPSFDPKATQTNPEDEALADSIMCLSYTASCFASNSASHYTRQQFENAIELVATATNGHVRAPRASTAPAKGPAQTPANPNSRRQQKKANKLAGIKESLPNA